MTAAPITGAVAADPYLAAVPAPAWRWLHHVNPLAKLAAPVPAIVGVLFTRDIATPLALIAVAYVILLLGARMSRSLALVLFVVVPLAVAAIALGLTLWTDPATLADPGGVLWRIGGWVVQEGALASGLSAALRITAMFVLAFVAGATITGPDLIRSAVEHLHLPYRIGYTALAAYRFIPRFQHELGVIRAAHRVRGRNGGRGPFAAFARGWGYVLPLFAGAIRHAERVALAMDSRAFGAHPTRTERHSVPWRWTDWLFLALFVVTTGVVFALTV
ncbi:energy-coupling factor transporter transmembrane component T family protein [Microbacterium gorillae]|uniref:energy-coupling factor transporter transmembrane component T family protein n=1 Tax=Microbacterium gorillae TaxID=1231063 RepID=UPI0005911826|nr:energy-coupling factor transporter transmembrane component T [Microbacterium gorillae]